MTQLKVFVFSANGSGLANLGNAYQRLLKTRPDLLSVIAFSELDLSNEKKAENILQQVARAENAVLIFRLHGGKTSCSRFDELMDANQGGRVFIDPQFGDESDLIKKHCPECDTPEFLQILQYLQCDGEDNWFNLLKLLAELPADPPRERPEEALYHPRLGAVDSLQQYVDGLGLTMRELVEGDKPVLGGWFHPVRWLDGDLEHIDGLIEEIEQQGCIPLFCFYRRVSLAGGKSKSTQWVLDNYFKKDGKTIIDVFLNLMHFSLSLLRSQETHLPGYLQVPRLQAVELFADHEHWSQTFQAVSPLDVCASYALPEFDGNLLTVPIATRESNQRDPYTGAVLQRHSPLPERIAKVVRMARNWAALGRKPNRQKKVAVVFHNYPPSNQNIGNAIGLDSFASVAQIIRRLKQEGYVVDRTYDDPQELADEIVGGLTSDRQWLTPEAMAARATDNAGRERTEAWTEELPARNQEHMRKDWGPAPGELFVHDAKVMINGLVNGNVYVGMQPPRGYIEQPEKSHDPFMSPSHHYLYYYRWLRDVFMADAVMHIGCHGSLEWLPGNSVALSQYCYPDLAIMELPNIYPYIINNPSEGTQTKRRSFSCLIDHLIPVMTNAGIHEALQDIDLKIQEYFQVEAMNPKALPVARQQLWDLVHKANLDQDLQISRDQAMADFDGFLEKLHGYLSEMADTYIAHGLHTLGQAPQGEGLVELATQLLRLRVNDIPSLREAVSCHWGLDYDGMLAKRGAKCSHPKFATNAQAIEAVHEQCLDLVRRRINSQAIPSEDVSPQIERALDYLAVEVLPRLEKTSDEMESIVRALSGRYIPPGGSGNPTRGQLEILPTGRNFYTVDPEKVPTRAAWETGVAMAEKLQERYQDETGGPVDTMGMVIWCVNTMRNQGEDIAQAFYLMGIEPVWDPNNGKVVGVRAVPLEKMKKPRVDITFRVSGCFRDTFPNVAEMMDRAVMMIAALQEPHNKNYLRQNVQREMAEFKREGMSEEEAFREASYRVFSCKPGTYGAGVCKAIDAKAWKTRDDLGEVFVTFHPCAPMASKGRATFRAALIWPFTGMPPAW